MSKKWSNQKLPGALHFVTGNVLDRKTIFKSNVHCRAFLSEMQALRTSCKIIAFVLMPDHFHLVANPQNDDIQTAMGVLKTFAAKKIIEGSPEGIFRNNGENQVWQESFKALPLWSGWMINQKINYIHANPVKADLCDTAAEYPWTSFRAFYSQESDPLLEIDKEWWWEGDHEKIARSVAQLEAEQREVLTAEIEANRNRRKV